MFYIESEENEGCWVIHKECGEVVISILYYPVPLVGEKVECPKCNLIGIIEEERRN